MSIASAAGDASPSRWYASYTRSRHEKQVQHRLQERGIESFLPLVHRWRQWKDRRKLVSQVMFPSYVFARFSLEQLSRVVSTPGITTVVRRDGVPVPIPYEELENVRRFAETVSRLDLDVEVVREPVIGECVLVVSGPFAGIEGMVVERRGRRRILVGLNATGQLLQVEIGMAAVKSLS